MNRIITSLLLALPAVTCVAAQAQRDSENDCAPDSGLGEIAVHAEVPEFIESGLTDGSMEPVGGVIRYSDDGQTVARLRQVGQAGQGAEAASNLLERVVVLSGQGHLALGRLLASVTPILNISMAGFSIVEHIAGIRAHEAELQRIYDRVSEEFQRDRRVELLAALDYAENTFLVESEEYRVAAVAEVNKDLANARKQLGEDLQTLLNAETSVENMELAASYLVLSMRVCALGTRLRLQINEVKAAVQWLSECVEYHRSVAKRFVRKLLGNSTALYFHESVSEENFDRYLYIESWLRGKRDVLRELVRTSRKSFWDEDAVDELFVRVPINRKELSNNPFYVGLLPLAEIAIVNYQRFEGFELELKSQGLSSASFVEREEMEGTLLECYDGYVLLVGSMPVSAGED